MYNSQNPLLPNYLYNLAPQMEIQKVNGEESARSFPLGPNSSVLLLDTNEPIVWVVVTDSSGYKTVSPFTITPYIPQKPVTTSDLNDKLVNLIDRIEKIEERMNVNAQSDNDSSRENQSSNARAQSNAGNGKSVSKSSSSSSANGSK